MVINLAGQGLVDCCDSLLFCKELLTYADAIIIIEN